MKNSAWYHKIWRKKLADLPLKKDDDAAWADMRNLLDEQLPVNAPLIDKNVYKLNVLTKTILLLVIAAIITVPAILYTGKHNTNSFKNNKHLPGHAEGHHMPNILSDTSSNQNLNGLTVADSNHPQSGTLAKSVTQNPRDTGNSSLITNKQVTVSHNLQLLSTAGLKPNAKQHQTDDKAGNGGLLNISSATRQASLSKQNILKGSNRHTNIINTGDKQKNQHSLSSGYITPNNISTKAIRDKAAKSNLETAGKRAPTTRVNDINDKAITSNNTTAEASKPAQANNDKEEADTKIDPVKNTANNTDTKEVKNTGSKSRAFNASQKTVKKVKNNPAKTKQSPPISNPQYNYGLEAGLNTGHGNSNLYLGVTGSYALNKKLLLNAGLRLNISKSISGEYSRASYYQPDSLPAFKVADSRKLMILDIPLTLEYRISNLISFNAGPVISIPLKQSGINYKYGPIVDERDTVYHTKTIDSTMRHSTVSKVNFGGTVGVTFRIKQFNIDARYQVITPYKVSNGFGNYSQSAKSFQIGIGYRFK